MAKTEICIEAQVSGPQKGLDFELRTSYQFRNKEQLW